MKIVRESLNEKFITHGKAGGGLWSGRSKTAYELHLNPVNLTNWGFESEVRGVIMYQRSTNKKVLERNGDLYIVNDNSITHDDMLALMRKELGMNTQAGDWHVVPMQYGFLTVVRYKKTNTLCIGESNLPIASMKPPLKAWIKEAFEACKLKNKDLEFIMKKYN